MKKSLILLSPILLVGCGIFSKSPDQVQAKTWRTQTNSKGEMEGPFPERQLRSLEGKKSLGIAVSGGGTRSATAFSGQLRGLHALGVMPDVKYISGVSGGMWGATPYVFYPASKQSKSVTLNQFVGEYVSPEKMTISDYKMSDSKRGFRTLAGLNATAGVLFQALIPGFFDGDERFAGAINKVYLSPLDLGNRNKYFTHDEETLGHALEANKKGGTLNLTGLSESDFYVASSLSQRQPFLIANGYINDLTGGNSEKTRPYHIEMTPQYVGVRRSGKNLKNTLRNKSHAWGGGLLETFAYDSLWTDKKNVFVHYDNFFQGVKPRFSLSDMMATTGAAPTVPTKLHKLSDIVGFPEFLPIPPLEYEYWNKDKSNLVNTEMKHTDGGAIDNSGLLPLLARRVDEVLLFANNDEDSCFMKHSDGSYSLPASFSNLFIPVKGKSRYGQRDFGEALYCLKNSKMKSGKTAYQDIVDQFADDFENGRPLVASGNYTTIHNPRHGVPAGHKVRIVWSMLGGRDTSESNARQWLPRTQWFENLNDSVKRSFLRRSYVKNSARLFPFSGTYLPQIPISLGLIDLSNTDVNLISNYTAYCVISAKKEFIKD